MADPLNKLTSISPDVLEAAQILVMMKHGIRAFLEAQQARYRIPYLYYASLNPTISPQLHYFSSHGIPLPLWHGMLASAHCIVRPSRVSTGAVSNNGESEGEIAQPAAKKLRLSSTSTGSPEQAVKEKQDAKRKRKNLTKEQLEILESVYEKDKYPHMDDRIKLEKPTNLTEDRIQVWFQNRRAKDRKKTEAEKLHQYFENSQKMTEECKKNGKQARKMVIKTEGNSDRRNSGSETSDNGESDNLSFNESPTK